MADVLELVDFRGNPLRKASLTKELATPSLTGVRNPWFETVASTLTPEVLAALLIGVDQNDNRDYLTLAEEMEERDLHYRSVLSTRKLAVAGLDIIVESVSDDAQAIKEADFVRDIFMEEAFRVLLMDQMDALGKGYSVSEIMWERGALWRPKEYRWRDPRHFQFDREIGDKLTLLDVSNLTDGIPLEAYKYIEHRPRLKNGLTIRGGLARLAAVSFMCKGYTLKDWLAFIEVYGMPLRLGKYDGNATAAQKLELLRAVANIGTDAAAIIPDSMEIEFVDGARSTGATGQAVFERISNWLDRQVSKGVLGQTMTTDDGSSKSQAEVHNDVRSDIQTYDASQLVSTIRRDLVRPLIDLNFVRPSTLKYPIFKLALDEPEDLELLAKSVIPFIKVGLPVERSVILDKFGLEEPADDAELLGGILNVEQQKDADAAAEEAKKKALENPPPPQPPVADPDAPPVEPAVDADPDRGVAGRRQELITMLVRKVMMGEELTEDQRLVMFADTKAVHDEQDEIDRLVSAEMGGWQQITNPFLQPIIDLANRVKNANEFLAGLKKIGADIDADPLVRSLATATLKARGLGDGTDEP